VYALPVDSSRKALPRSRWAVLLAVVWFSLVWCSAAVERRSAQAERSAPPPGGAASAAEQLQTKPAAAESTGANVGGSASATVDIPQQKISPKQGEDLLRSVDEILKFASKDTLLPVKADIKRRLVDRDTVTAFVRTHLAEDDDAQRLRRSELVLKKFGLLPQDFDLQAFLVLLLREQVAGYYDPQTKTVNLLDWIDPEQQKPVLAHELTHALQDQSFGLEHFLKGGGDLGASEQPPTVADIQNDEASAAHQAVVEGQAMVVLLDYELAPTGQALVDSPQIVEALKQGMATGTADSIEFRSAPLYLREALTFPYRYGLDFEAELLTKRGKDEAYAGVFRHPPTTTREIMQPETYLAGERIAPPPTPDFAHDFKAYDKFDAGAVGEFDVAILIDQYAGVEISKRLYPHWRGGYYYTARPKGDPSAPLGLLYVSRWSNAERAAEFASVYARSLPQRYLHVRDTSSDAAPGRPADFVVQTLTGNHSWLTEQGPVFIDVQGDTVLVAESLDQTTTEQVEHELFRVTAGATAAK
jgi:hypothetical protein